MVAIADTVASIRRRERRRSALASQRRRFLEDLLPRAREILLRRGAKEVFIFGSVVDGSTTPNSDLDLATSGLPPEAYFPALGELMAAVPCDIDLVRLEEAGESLRDRVSSEGRRL